MNPETKRFEPETVRTPDGWPRFRVGEVFTLNGVRMRVRKVTNKDLVLRPVKDDRPPMGAPSPPLAPYEADDLGDDDR